MPLNLASVSSFKPPTPYNGGLLISWAGNLPSGSVWQVYQGDALLGSTRQNRMHVPAPPGTVQFAVGSVPAAEAGTSFASDLPPTPKTRVTLSWQGGRYEDPADGDVMGFHVYGEDTPGGGIDYNTILADIPVFTAGIATDGWGLGGYGSGGFGYGAGNYSWESDSLSSGTYNWAVVPYDSAGNEGAAATCATTIAAPPTDPPPWPDGQRLHYTLLGFSQFGYGIGGYGEPEIQLFWNPSTG